MSFILDAQNSVNDILTYGTPVRIKFFNASGGSATYDDNKTLTQSGSDVWTTGFKQELNSKKGSFEAQLLEEGRLLFHDSRLYIGGSIPTSGILRIGIGSPSREEYQVLMEGVAASPHFDSGGELAYKKLFIRFLKNGSLMGE
jgi:hypothetical protein